MSKAKPQSSRRRSMRRYFRDISKTNSTKRNNMRVQAIHIKPPKKRGRKSKAYKIREKWLERLPFHIGKTKFIYQQLK
jgi:hypothetical protein